MTVAKTGRLRRRSIVLCLRDYVAYLCLPSARKSLTLCKEWSVSNSERGLETDSTKLWRYGRVYRKTTVTNLHLYSASLH